MRAFKATLPQKVATNSQKAATINIKGEKSIIVTATVYFEGSESRAVNSPSLQILRINRKGMINDIIMGYSRKNPHPHDERHAGKSHGRWG